MLGIFLKLAIGHSETHPSSYLPMGPVIKAVGCAIMFHKNMSKPKLFGVKKAD